MAESLCWLERRAGRDSASTYLVQIPNKPHRIIVFEDLFTLHILLPMKHVIELVSKIGQRAVETMKFLQC